MLNLYPDNVSVVVVAPGAAPAQRPLSRAREAPASLYQAYSSSLEPGSNATEASLSAARSRTLCVNGPSHRRFRARALLPAQTEFALSASYNWADTRNRSPFQTSNVDARFRRICLVFPQCASKASVGISSLKLLRSATMARRRAHAALRARRRARVVAHAAQIALKLDASPQHQRSASDLLVRIPNRRTQETIWAPRRIRLSLQDHRRDRVVAHAAQIALNSDPIP